MPLATSHSAARRTQPISADVSGLVTVAEDGREWGVLFESGCGRFAPVEEFRATLPVLSPVDLSLSTAVSHLVAYHQHQPVVWPASPRDPAPSRCRIAPWLFGGSGGWNPDAVSRLLSRGIYGALLQHVSQHGVDLMVSGPPPRGASRNYIPRDFRDLVDEKIQRMIADNILVDI